MKLTGSTLRATCPPISHGPEVLDVEHRHRSARTGLSDPVPGLTVTRAEDDGGGGTLREVIAAAEIGSRITFAPALAGSTIRLDGIELVIGKSLVIDAFDLTGGIAICGDRTGDGPCCCGMYWLGWFVDCSNASTYWISPLSKTEQLTMRIPEGTQ